MIGVSFGRPRNREVATGKQVDRISKFVPVYKLKVLGKT